MRRSFEYEVCAGLKLIAAFLCPWPWIAWMLGALAMFDMVMACLWAHREHGGSLNGPNKGGK